MTQIDVDKILGARFWVLVFCDNIPFIIPRMRCTMPDRQNISSGSPYEPVFGYSRAVRMGNQVFVSGTVAWGDDGKVTGEGDMYAQARQAIRNIEKALAQAGASLADVVRTRTFVTDVSRFDEVAKAHGEAFGDVRPAATVVEVKALVDTVMLVEIEADAVVA
jgi:enamine deaminase RidA (YjgF/YER057c/UK114 family)